MQVGILKIGHTSEIICALDHGAEIGKDRGIRQSSAGFIALKDRLPGSIVVIGNAPSVLLMLCDFIKEQIRPAAIIGTTVGFVNAAESKEGQRAIDIPPSPIREPKAVAAINECITIFIEGQKK